MTFNGGFDGGEGMRYRRPTFVHDAVGKSYDGVYVGGGVEEEGGEMGSVRTEPSIRIVRIMWGMLLFGGSWSEHQRVFDVSG